MKHLACFLFVFITGCSSIPVAPKFPEVPENIIKKCPQLQKLGEEPKLSDIAKTVTNNYTTYYECTVKHDAFIEWYEVQKKIYESVK